MRGRYSRLDDIDTHILQVLQTDASISNVNLASAIGLSPAATLTRVKKMEQDGIIEGYSVELNKEKIGLQLLCFVQVSLENHSVDLVKAFRVAIKEMPEVMECHFVTGMSDYLLKVVVRDRQALEHFLVHKLTPTPGVSRMQTSLVLSEVKTRTIYPVYRGQDTT